MPIRGTSLSANQRTLFRWNTIGTAFNNATGVTTFPELELFTNTIELYGWAMGSSLHDFKLPQNLKTLGSDSLRMNSLNMQELACPSSLKVLYNVRQSGYVGCITIISALTSIGASYCYGRSISGTNASTFKILYSGGVIPLSTSATVAQYNRYHYYYVPDNLLNQYREATGWRDFPTHILPLSEYPD